MVQRYGEKNGNNLPDLPPSNNSFWKGARKYQSKPKNEKCEHYFEYGQGREVNCKLCHIGYYLSPGMYVKEGRIEIRA